MTVRRAPVPRPPAGLAAGGAALWRCVVREFALELHHLAILRAACQALDRIDEARAAIDRDGAYVIGRYGPKSHPALAIERDSRLAMIRGLRELGLDLAPTDSRPPSRWR